MGEAIPPLVEMWDDVVSAFLDGEPSVPKHLEEWAAGYRGRGRGRVSWDAVPEPYLGSLTAGRPRGVFLALNPGRAHADFQGRGGIFDQEMRSMGSYSAWASSWPYLRDPWIAANGRNRHHELRLTFLRRWHQDLMIEPRAMVSFELYPWHSTAKTAAMRPPRELVRRWVWEPVAELDAPAFAFGADWFTVLEQHLGLAPVVRLGVGGLEYGSSVASRAITLFRDEVTHVSVIAERHLGGAGPPSADETELLRQALAEWLE